MARLVLQGALLLVVLGSTHTAHAQAEPEDVPSDVVSVADDAETTLDFQPPLIGAVAQADCVIQKESGGLDVPNRQGSGATGPGQYMPSTWVRHVAVYRAGTGYLGPLSLHVLADVRSVMAFVLALPAWPHNYRAEWAVGGC